MKELLLIHRILSARAEEEAKEQLYCIERDLKFAAQYAAGKSAAYSHAANLLLTYINAESPFEINNERNEEHD